jgi:predicted Zn-dependent protease
MPLQHPNITRQSKVAKTPHRLRDLAVALCMGALASSPPAAMAQVRLPSMGDTASETLPVGQERRYGEQIMREVWRDPDYLDDPVLVDYLESIWRPLVEAARQRGNIDDDVRAQFAWNIFLVRDRSVNAFALPGGYVGIHLGLIAMTASKDELASVIAHELTHVTQRHIARSIASAGQQSTLGMVAMILGVLAASRAGNADIAQAAIAGGQAGMIQGQLNFSRDMEREADRIGYGVYSEAGYGAGGMAAMFEKLDQANRLNDNGAFPYLRSHPLTLERLSEARARATLANASTPGPNFVHAMMQARARVLMDNTAIGLKHAVDSAGGGRDAAQRASALYAGALAALLSKDFVLAEKHAAQLRALVEAQGNRDPAAQRVATLLQVQLALARGDAPVAQTLLREISKDTSRAALFARAETALQLPPGAAGTDKSALGESGQALQTWVAEHRDDAPAWALLARSDDALGKPLRALRAQAEARLAVGDMNAAIDRLRAAQRQSREASGADFMDASVIDARLRELQSLQRAARADQRGRGAGRDGGDGGRSPD